MNVVWETAASSPLTLPNSEAKPMSTEFNELLSHPHGDRTQIWIVGSREQVNHTINEMYVKEMTADRSQFSPLLPVPFAPGKFMSVLLR